MNPDIPWVWSRVSRNPNITLDIVYANPGKPWDYSELSLNNFGYNDTIFEREYMRMNDELPELLCDY